MVLKVIIEMGQWFGFSANEYIDIKHMQCWENPFPQRITIRCCHNSCIQYSRIVVEAGFMGPKVPANTTQKLEACVYQTSCCRDHTLFTPPWNKTYLYETVLT